MRPLFLLTASLVPMDTLFFAAVAPLLPEYSEDLHLSKTGAADCRSGSLHAVMLAVANAGG
jgi:hypothetical protein